MTEKKVVRELDGEELTWLSGLVDNPHSDYDEEIEGWANYSVHTEDGRLILKVTYQSDDDEPEFHTARWALSIIDSKLEVKA